MFIFNNAIACRVILKLRAQTVLNTQTVSSLFAVHITGVDCKGKLHLFGFPKQENTRSVGVQFLANKV